MKLRIIARKAAVALLALAPVLADATAADHKAAVNCAEAFAKSLNRSYRLLYDSPGMATSPFESQFSFDLKARDAKSGGRIAMATCTTSRTGELIELRPVKY